MLPPHPAAPLLRRLSEGVKWVISLSLLLGRVEMVVEPACVDKLPPPPEPVTYFFPDDAFFRLIPSDEEFAAA